MSIQDCINSIQSKISNSKGFKIGKTGQTSTDRFNQEYKNKYSRIFTICQSTSSKPIDEYEIALIKHFKNYPNNENDQNGGGSMSTSSGNTYIVYVVIR